MKNTMRQKKPQPVRCSLCGQPNPEHDEGYSECCNKYLTYPGDPDYIRAKKEWNR